MKKLLAITAIFALTGCKQLGLERIDAKQERLNEINEIASVVDAPTISSSQLQSAQEAEKAGNLAKAEYYYGQLLESKPDNLDYQFAYSEILRKSGRCNDAIKGYEKILGTKPNDLNAQEGKGLCLLANSKNRDASDVFAKIIETEPTRWKSLNAAGLIFAADKKYNEAAQYFNAAAEYSNNNPAVLNNQGLAKALTGNFKDAIAILEDALVKAEDRTGQKRSIALNLAMVYGISGNSDLAERTAKPYLTEPQLYNNLGVYADLAKDKDLAKTYLNKAMQGTQVYYERAWENLERVKSER